MHSVKQGIAWAKSAAAETRGGKSWQGWCQSYVFRFMGASHSATTAYLGYKASGPVISKDPKKAPAGAIHWWSDGGPGHVAISLGDGIAAMASSAVTTSWGRAQGTISVARYNALKPNLTYLGWTYDMCGQRMTDIQEYLDDKAAKKKAAVAKEKAELAAKAKAAEEKAKLEADKKATLDKALADAAEQAPQISDVQAIIPLVRERNSRNVYLLSHGTTKVLLNVAQYHLWKALGAAVTVVPDGSLAAFKDA